MNFFNFFIWPGISNRHRGLNKPSEFVLAADQDGILPPEIAALKGRQQPPQWHPEGDAFVHTLLAIDRAFELGASQVVMWATLLHDLGKAVTPDDQLPHHYNHEALGVPLVHQLCDRLGVEEPYRTVAALAAKEHLNVHKFLELRPVKKVDLILRLGEHVEDVAFVAQADAQGRGPTLVDKPYPQREAIVAAAQIIAKTRRETIENMLFQDKILGLKADQKIRMACAKALQGKFGK